MNINVIYTFADYPQRFADIEITDGSLDSKQGLFTRLVFKLSKKLKQKLIKISCSISADRSHPALQDDHWYTQCNGKYWDDEIPSLMKDLFDVDINYVPVN